MQAWTLGPGAPQSLTLAADFRLCSPDYTNDQIWELQTGGGDPPALSFHTTYGLRARVMRLFPRFSLGTRSITDPAAFPSPPRIRQFYPNFLLLDFSPFREVDVVAEYWIPDSHTSAGRFTVTSRRVKTLPLVLELCAQLAPLEGQGLAPVSIHSVNILSGRTCDLAPVLFLTGGPRPGPGPYPSLTLDMDLPGGSTRCLTWVHAALANQADSFSLARRTAARPWEAELARIERTNAAQTVEIQTGEPDWDAAFALSQKTAFSLFFGPSQAMPNPSFVMSRQPDQGHSSRTDGGDYPPSWSGQTPLEAGYLAGLLPGAPDLAAGLLRNFLASQTAEGAVDWKPGLAGQRGRWLSAPLLADLAWQVYQRSLDLNFLRSTQAALNAFVECWFTPAHDRDLDGFPEWDHPMQTGLEDNPAFSVWLECGQGAAISAAESPALAAMLMRELLSLSKIATALSQPVESRRLEERAGELRRLVEECWDTHAVLYHYRDRDTHHSSAGRTVGHRSGPGLITPSRAFPVAVRLLVRINLKTESTRRPEVTLRGQADGMSVIETLGRVDFQWCAGSAVATSRHVFTRLDELEVSGVEKRDQVSVQIMDLSGEDISLFLPLWAGVPAPERAAALANQTVFAPDRFGRLFGISACVPAASTASQAGPDPLVASACQAVHLPWNALVGEGLLAYGLRTEAAQLVIRLMAAVIQNLKQQHAFFRAYHAETGAGLGERNAIQGLAPLGLFMQVLGVTIQSPERLILSGKNPFPWPVTVKYRGLVVTRQAERTVVVFPDGQTTTLDDPTDAVISAG